MGSRVCWACSTYSHMTKASAVLRRRTWDGEDLFATFTCDNCETPSVGLLARTVYDSRSEDDLIEGGNLRWLPQRGVGKDFPDVPEHIGQAADEAYQCRSINALRAAVLLARSVIEATAKEKGITKGLLAAKIQAMVDQELIRKRVREGADEVRHLGKDMAHGDFVEPVSEEDADLVLELMDEVLQEVFQAPARNAKARANREARKAQRPDG